MTARPLLQQQAVTAKGDAPSRDLVEIIQRIVADVQAAASAASVAALDARVTALDARVTALEANPVIIAPGAAPAYACRAWVNFNGTGTVAIRAAQNVASITDNGVGDYTINFTTPMVDANYAVALSYTNEVNVQHGVGFIVSQTAASVRIKFYNAANGANTMDKSIVSVAVFR